MSYHPFKNSAIRATWLQRSLEEHGAVCWLCLHPLPDVLGVAVEAQWATTFDHVVPRALGGGDEYGNLRLAHHHCNQKRGTESINPNLRTMLRLQVPRSIRRLAIQWVRSA